MCSRKNQQLLLTLQRDLRNTDIPLHIVFQKCHEKFFTTTDILLRTSLILSINFKTKRTQSLHRNQTPIPPRLYIGLPKRNCQTSMSFRMFCLCLNLHTYKFCLGADLPFHQNIYLCHQIDHLPSACMCMTCDRATASSCIS